ncbi:alpha/beta hydrolase [Frankia sp. Cr1]|uniref:alpha/beta hydrolase n=1 Tax=Frankia sp. Cr1 TaxID=3073931 RepID=UPI002AD27166|nr:alpha/beta hydrolase [Frankia sp. Cr1]
MPVDPQFEAVLKQAAAAGLPPFHTLTPVQARALYAQLMALPDRPVPVVHVADRMVPGPAGELPVRIYRPGMDGRRPVLTYFHGGGWTLGDLASDDWLCRRLAVGADTVVVSVDYRRAPEHPFPAALNDAVAGYLWAREHAGEIGGDGGSVAVGGWSAGGNLAAAACLELRGENVPAAQVLLTPAVDATMALPSHTENATGFGLDAMTGRWFTENYVPDPAQRSNPLVSPLAAVDLSGLPPAVVYTAEYDVLRDEGEAYANRLEQAGTKVIAKRVEGLDHLFHLHTAVVDAAADAVDQLIADVADILRL